MNITIKNNKNNNNNTNAMLSDSIQLLTEDSKPLTGSDILSGLPERTHAIKQLKKQLEIAKKEDKILALYYVELAEFSWVNDIYEQSTVDNYMATVAVHLKQMLRDDDVLFRHENDFIIGILVKKELLTAIDKHKRQLKTGSTTPLDINGYNIPVEMNIGVATYPMHGNQVGTLFDIAYHRMQREKEESESYRNTHIVADDKVVLFTHK